MCSHLQRKLFEGEYSTIRLATYEDIPAIMRTLSAEPTKK